MVQLKLYLLFLDDKHRGVGVAQLQVYVPFLDDKHRGGVSGKTASICDCVLCSSPTPNT